MNANNDQLHVTFWGTRGSIAAPGRMTEKYGGNTSCVSMTSGDQTLIFDAGTGIRLLGVDILRQGIPDNQKELNLFLSHTHWDHIQGLPFFEPAYIPKFKLNIHGNKKSDVFLESILSGQMNFNYFPVPMSAFGSEWDIHELDDSKLNIGHLEVTFQEMNHPGGSVAYKVETSDGKSAIYATDNELDQMFNEDLSVKDNHPLSEDYMNFIRNADLLIADGQYTEEEYKTRTGWGHSTIPMLLKRLQSTQTLRKL